MTTQQLTEVLQDWKKRESLRRHVVEARNVYEYSPRRFWNPAMDAARGALTKLQCELDAYEHNEWRLTDPYLHEKTAAVLRAERPQRAQKIAARLATAKALIAACEAARAPQSRESAVQRETERELRAHLASRGVEVSQTAVAQAPAHLQPRPANADLHRIDTTTKNNQTRRFWACAKSAGMCVGMRAARLRFAAAYLGIESIESFDALTAEQIGRLADALHGGDVESNWALREKSFAVA